MRPLQCPEVPRRCTRCSTRRLHQSCRGFPPCTTSESSTTVRRRECCRVRSRWGCSHCRTCARRTHWRQRRPTSSRWHRRGLRWERCATGTLVGGRHSVCAKCFIFTPCILTISGMNTLGLFFNVPKCLFFEGVSVKPTCTTHYSTGAYALVYHQLWEHLPGFQS